MEKSIYLVVFLLFISPLAHGCGAPRPKPPPETVDGFTGGEFTVDPRLILVEEETWVCLVPGTPVDGDPTNNQCWTRFRISLMMELEMFTLTEPQYCSCGFSLGTNETVLNNKRAVAPFQGAIIETVTFIAWDTIRNEETRSFPAFTLNTDINSATTLQGLLDDPTGLLTQVDGFLGIVEEFDASVVSLLDDNEAIVVRFQIAITYDTSTATTEVLPNDLPGCNTATVNCGEGEVNEKLGETNNVPSNPLDFPNFAFKVATGSSNSDGESVGGHPVNFAPATYAAGQCINDTMCDYCVNGQQDCFTGHCDFGNPPQAVGLCRMCANDTDCSRFNLPKLDPELGGPFVSTCTDIGVCTRIYILNDEQSSDNSARPLSSPLF